MPNTEKSKQEIMKSSSHGAAIESIPLGARQRNAPQSNMQAHHWTSEALYYDGDSFFQDLCKDFEQAKKSIYIETYIFANDKLGKRITEILISAAKRGIDVKVIVDGFGSPLWKYYFQSQLIEAGVKCKIYHRIPFNLFHYFPFLFTNFKRLFSRLEKRNHRKLYIVDGNIAYVGSMNIAAYHLQEFKNGEAWRDTCARVTGPELPILVEAFYSSWKSSLFYPIGVLRNSSLVRIYNSRKIKYSFYRDFLNRIDKSQERIWLTTAYFVPTGSLLLKLHNAAKRNIDIKIITTSKTDMFLIRWMRSAFYLGLLKAGAKIFEYQPSVLHAKCALIDDFAMVGSTNLNNRSFFHDLEVDVVLNSPESLDSLDKQFLLDLKKSKEIVKSEWMNPTLGERILASIALLFRHWL